MTVLSTKDIVQLLLAGSEHTLRLGRLPNGGYILDGRGGLGRRYTESNWVVRVHSKSASIISLSNEGFNLGVASGKLVLKNYGADVRPGQESQFFIRATDTTSRVILEPLAFPGCFIGADHSGKVLNVFKNHELGSVIQVYVENPVTSGTDIFPLVPDGPGEISPLGLAPCPVSPSSPGHPGAPSASGIDRSPTSPEAVEAIRTRLQQLISPTSPAPGGPKQPKQTPVSADEGSKPHSSAFEFAPRITEARSRDSSSSHDDVCSRSRDSSSSHDDVCSTSETSKHSEIDEKCGYMKYYLNAPLRSQHVARSAVVPPPSTPSQQELTSSSSSESGTPQIQDQLNSTASPTSPSGSSPTVKHGAAYVAPWRKPRNKPPSTGISDF